MRKTTRSFRHIGLALFVACGAMTFTTRASSQGYQVLHEFSNAQGAPYGALLQTPDGSLYGTLSRGGRFGYGSVFVLRPDGSGGFLNAELYAFNGSDGQFPQAGLILAADGYFYGTTLISVFRIDAAGNLTTMHKFNYQDGTHVTAPLIQASDGYFYGTTGGGGTGAGTAFRMDTQGHLTTLHLFRGTDGSSPLAPLLQGLDGNFYGTTYSGGASGRGTAFRMDPAGQVTTLHSFNWADGANPTSPLALGVDGNYYGTASNGGATSGGVIYRLDSSGAFTTVYNFPGATGANPAGGLLSASDGALYGTTYYSTPFPGNGEVFRMDLGGNVTPLHDFTGQDGMNPNGPLIQGVNGDFYGTTVRGGAGGIGTAYRMDAAGSVTTIQSFMNLDGRYPQAALIETPDGSFYGTTVQGGGLSANGTIFKIDPTGVFTTLHSFAGEDGLEPYAALLLASDGNFYGTTYTSGAAPYDGTIFRMDAVGNVTTLYAFNGNDGANPAAPLIEGADGFLYGVTSAGGPSGLGTIFRLDSVGNLTTLHLFAGPEGASPWGALTQGSDGRFYGTTSRGGALDLGTVFRMDSAGTLETLYSFDGTQGQYPTGALIEASDGGFYGTADPSGESSDYGTIFRMGPGGDFATIHFFTSLEGGMPSAGIIQGKDGNFFGTATVGGGGYGGVFVMDAGGHLTVLHSFRGPEGAVPLDALLEGTDGYLYGTASGGGGPGGGVVFRLPACSPSRPLSITQIAGTNPSCQGSSITLDAGPGYLSYLWYIGAQTETITDSPTASTTYYLRVVNECGVAYQEWTQEVVPPPIATITAGGPTTFCAGQSVTLTADGGTSYLWSTGATSRSIVAGASGIYFVVATDSNGCSATSPSVCVNVSPSPTVNPSNIPGGTAGQSYPGVTFSQTGGISPATFALSGGLPSGMTFASGVLAGTPMQTGSFPVTVTATDSNGCTGNASYVIDIGCPQISVGPAAIPAATLGVFSGFLFSTSGGVGTVALVLTGSVPNGMFFSGNTLAGIPTQLGTFPFAVTAIDGNGCTGSRSYTLSVTCGTITISPASLPPGRHADYYSQAFTQTGGIAPVAFALTGSLPNDLKFDGVTLSGKPTKKGTYSFTITATDADGCTGNQAYSLVIN